MVWQRWLKEYLPMLTARPKWYDDEKNLKIGDVVLLVQPGLPRENWPLGRIVDSFPGKDGHTRVAKVQCGEKTCVRPMHKLDPLDI